jgi:hypothetical protein
MCFFLSSELWVFVLFFGGYYLCVAFLRVSPPSMQSESAATGVSRECGIVSPPKAGVSAVPS